MVGGATVGAAMGDSFFCLVFGQALLCVVVATADPAYSFSGAICLVVAKPLTFVATERLWCIGPQVESPPIPESK